MVQLDSWLWSKMSQPHCKVRMLATEKEALLRSHPLVVGFAGVSDESTVTPTARTKVFCASEVAMLALPPLSAAI